MLHARALVIGGLVGKLMGVFSVLSGLGSLLIAGKRHGWKISSAGAGTGCSVFAELDIAVARASR